MKKLAWLGAGACVLLGGVLLAGVVHNVPWLHDLFHVPDVAAIEHEIEADGDRAAEEVRDDLAQQTDAEVAAGSAVAADHAAAAERRSDDFDAAERDAEREFAEHLRSDMQSGADEAGGELQAPAHEHVDAALDAHVAELDAIVAGLRADLHERLRSVPAGAAPDPGAAVPGGD